MGVAQLEQLQVYIEKKRQIAGNYDEALRGIVGITPMRQAPWAHSVFWMYTVLVDQSEFGLDSRDLLRELGKRNIQTRPLWQPLHLSNAHTGAQSTDCSTSEKLNLGALSLPCSVGLDDQSQTRVIECITAIQQQSLRRGAIAR
jgi:perosamine synthetase